MKRKVSIGPKLTGYVMDFYSSGDERALSPVFVALNPYLSRFTFATLGVDCPAKRSDLVQESLIHILEMLRERKFSGRMGPNGAYNSILPWVCMVHRNLFINGTRGKKIPSKPNAAEDSLERVAVNLVSQAAEPDSLGVQAEASKLLGVVTAQVDALPEKQRVAFQLFYYRGMPYDEIAKALGVPSATCRVQVHLALKSLKAWAEKSPIRPTEPVYDVLRVIDTGDKFTEGNSRYAPRGFFSKRKGAAVRMAA